MSQQCGWVEKGSSETDVWYLRENVQAVLKPAGAECVCLPVVGLRSPATTHNHRFHSIDPRACAVGLFFEERLSTGESAGGGQTLESLLLGKSRGLRDGVAWLLVTLVAALAPPQPTCYTHTHTHTHTC